MAGTRTTDRPTYPAGRSSLRRSSDLPDYFFDTCTEHSREGYCSVEVREGSWDRRTLRLRFSAFKDSISFNSKDSIIVLF